MPLMANGGSGGSSGSSGGNANKVGALLLGAGLLGLIILVGPGPFDGDDGGDAPPATTDGSAASGDGGPPPTSAPAQPTARGASTARPSATLAPTDEVVLRIVAYGLPARVSAHLRPGEEGMRTYFPKSCAPEEIFPDPCVAEYTVKKGTTVVVSAGDSLAGYWPGLKSLKGPGCDIVGPVPRDQECTLTLVGDVELVAVYVGSESPPAREFPYPECPHRPGNNLPAWLSRCK